MYNVKSIVEKTHREQIPIHLTLQLIRISMLNQRLIRLIGIICLVIFQVLKHSLLGCS
ncbi:hypothetical protein H7Y21_02380 [Arenimonas sp.]|nr:hypothetical protein [Candidatus Parcubacteria bacterium]